MPTDDILVRRLTLRNPFRVETLSWFSRLHRAAYRPRRRAAKRLVGRPAKTLFRLAFAWKLAPGRSAFALDVDGTERRAVVAGGPTRVRPR